MQIAADREERLQRLGKQPVSSQLPPLESGDNDGPVSRYAASELEKKAYEEKKLAKDVAVRVLSLLPSSYSLQLTRKKRNEEREAARLLKLQIQAEREARIAQSSVKDSAASASPGSPSISQTSSASSSISSTCMLQVVLFMKYCLPHELDSIT